MQNLFSNQKIYIKNKDITEAKIKSFKKQNLQIVADFDSTITQDNGHTSWSLF